MLPVFPLTGAMMLPRARLPLNIFEPRYLAMIDGALITDRFVGMVQPRPSQPGTDYPPLFDIGCAGRLTQFAETGDGRYLVTLTGICRYRIKRELSVQSLYRQVEADYSEFEDDLFPDDSELPFERDSLIDSLRTYFNRFGQQVDWDALRAAPAEAMVGSLTAVCPFRAEEKQALLEAPTLQARAEMLVGLVEMAIAEDQGPMRSLQ